MLDELESILLDDRNSGPFLICALVMDVSRFMVGGPICELNKAYSDFRKFIRDGDVLFQRIQVVVIEFSSSARVIVPLQEGRALPELTFTADGLTAMGAAINKALDVIEARKQKYIDKEIEFYRPWVIVLSDGSPTDEEVFENAINRLNEATSRKSVAVLPISIGDNAGFKTLSRLSLPQRSAVKLTEFNLSDFLTSELWIPDDDVFIQFEPDTDELLILSHHKYPRTGQDRSE